MRNIRSFCVSVLRSHLGESTAIAIDTRGSNYGRPLFLAPCFISPSEGRRERAKKALEKKVEQEEGRGREGGREREVPLSSDYRRISLAYFRPPSLSLSFSLSPLWSFRRTSLSFPRVTHVSPVFFRLDNHPLSNAAHFPPIIVAPLFYLAPTSFCSQIFSCLKPSASHVSLIFSQICPHYYPQTYASEKILMRNIMRLHYASRNNFRASMQFRRLFFFIQLFT